MTKRCAQGHPGKHRESHLAGGGDVHRTILTPGNRDGGTCGAAPQPHPPLMQNGKVTLISMAEETQGDEVENPCNRQSCGNLDIAQSRAPWKVPEMWLTFSTKSLRFCAKDMPEIRRDSECPIHPLSKASPTFLKYSMY